jgi:hypothetical protein
VVKQRLKIFNSPNLDLAGTKQRRQFLFSFSRHDVTAMRSAWLGIAWRVDGQLGIGPVRARMGEWKIKEGDSRNPHLFRSSFARELQWKIN